MDFLRIVRMMNFNIYGELPVYFKQKVKKTPLLQSQRIRENLALVLSACKLSKLIWLHKLRLFK